MPSWMSKTLTARDAAHRYTLRAEAPDTGHKAWVAVVTDTHPEYGYDRDFVAYQDADDDRPAEGSSGVRDGSIVEEVHVDPQSGHRSEQWFHVDGGELRELSEQEAEVMLERR